MKGGKSVYNRTRNLNSNIKKKWIKEQQNLKKCLKISNSNKLKNAISSDKILIGGVDISFLKNNKELACAGIVVIEYSSDFTIHKKVYEEYKIVKMDVPYIPTFLAYREVPHLEKLINNLKKKSPDLIPNVIIVDGLGMAHPRRFGLASHLGVLVDIPTIGIGKTFMDYGQLHARNVYRLLKEKLPHPYATYNIEVNNINNNRKNKTNANILSTAFKPNIGHPIFISIGHNITLKLAVELVKKTITPEFRLPLPVHCADYNTRIIIDKLSSCLQQCNHLNEDCKKKCEHMNFTLI